MAEKRPLDALEQAKGSRVMVALKNGDQVVGVLKAFDIHLNLWLEDAEKTNGEKTVKLGTAILRGDNILIVSPE
jgi:small nuclear ribonucleoprotein